MVCIESELETFNLGKYWLDFFLHKSKQKSEEGGLSTISEELSAP